jgi:hypothetical protein
MRGPEGRQAEREPSPLAWRPSFDHNLCSMKRLGLAVIALLALGIAGCAHKKPQNITLSATVPALTPRSCHSENGLPDSACTPGEVRTTDANSICHGGSTKQFRPPSSFTDALKRQQLIAYGYADTNPSDYEEDHLISLEIGGAGSDPKNLWPEPHAGKDNSFEKDKVENWLHRQICSGAMTPTEAQKAISTDWRQFLPQVDGVATKKKEVQ